MTTSTLAIDALAAVGVAGPVPVTVRLTDLNGDDVPRAFIEATGAAIVVPSSTRCAADGTLTVSLTPNSEDDNEITPENTYYTVRVAGTDFLISKSANDGETLLSCIVPAPLPLGPVRGATGLSILNGTGAPSSGTGSNGEFYIDTVTTSLYGPKASGVWPSGIVLPGADGSTVLNGAGAPSGGTGVDGDFYINTTAHTIYGPKAAGAWGSATSLVGTAGADGNTILYGAGAPSNGLGVNGNFYVDTTAVAIYGPKAAGSWPTGTSLVGPTGAAGSSILNGSGAPSGGTGNNGDFYINTAATTIYGPKTAGAWGSPTSLVGATGAAYSAFDSQAIFAARVFN